MGMLRVPQINFVSLGCPDAWFHTEQLIKSVLLLQQMGPHGVHMVPLAKLQHPHHQFKLIPFFAVQPLQVWDPQ